MKKFLYAFLLCIFLWGLLPLSTPTHALAIPTITITGVTENEKVTIETKNFPAEKTFEVRMGLFGTKGIDGILAGEINSGQGGELRFTLNIPDSLHGKSMIAIRLKSTTSGHYAYNWFYNQNYGDHEGENGTSLAPTIVAVSVKEGENVIIKTHNFPAGEAITVLMDVFGTQAIDGQEIETFDSEEGGALTKTFTIPKSLKDEYKLAIRLESKDSALSTATWFINQTGASGGTGSGAMTSIPTITILSVEEGVNVTVKTHNFPANKDFKVLMGEMGTRGIGGLEVETINSAGGGSFTATFDIPTTLQNTDLIAIRLQTANNVYFAYNWFYNNTTGATNGNGNGGFTGIPTFTITGVVDGTKVSIKTNNFPANVDFKVLMGKMGTKGIGGTVVTTINSASGGTFTETFDIPAGLASDSQIALRLEAVSSGYYAYNWFYNEDYP